MTKDYAKLYAFLAAESDVVQFTGLSRHQYSMQDPSLLSNRLIKVFKVTNIQSGRNARDNKDTASPPELAIVRRIKD